MTKKRISVFCWNKNCFLCSKMQFWKRFPTEELGCYREVKSHWQQTQAILSTATSQEPGLMSNSRAPAKPKTPRWWQQRMVRWVQWAVLLGCCTRQRLGSCLAQACNSSASQRDRDIPSHTMEALTGLMKQRGFCDRYT